MDPAFALGDELGPGKVLHIREGRTGLRAIVVVDNVACGPAIGGARMAADATLEECARLARAMTLKNAVAGLPHGGGKSVIIADPRMSDERRERLIRAFARAIADMPEYIVGPDMGTDERCMAWVHDEIGRAVGLPAAIGGIPLDEIGATGFGLAASVEVAAHFCELPLEGARVVVQGFGAVGTHAARFLAERGATLVAASDSRGAVYDERGLDLTRLLDIKGEGRSVTEYDARLARDADELIDIPCEVWIPAARPDVITLENVGRLNTRIVAQGANIPATESAENALHERGVLSLPDFIANAGGVICAAVEYHGGGEAAAFSSIDERIRANTTRMLEGSATTGMTPRAAAMAMARARVRAAMEYRRSHR